MSTVSFLSQLYTNILGRNPDASGLAWWADVIDSGRANAAEVTRDFIDSPEFGGVVQPLARLYYAAFGRIPDAGGLQYWTHNAQGGQSYADIVEYFAASPEFAKLYGQLDNAAFLDALSNTALGHAMDSGTKATWLAQLTSGSATRADVLSGVVSSNDMATAKAGEVKAIAAYYGTLGTMPTQADLTAALAANDPAALITKLYASAAYQGVAAPGLIAHGTITDALGHGATVFIDTNANGVLDAGEISAKADGAGNFDFGSSAAFKGQLTVQGTSGAAFTAPAGATVVNALTTLVQGVAASQHLDTAAAERAVSSALGLGAWDLLHTDFTATAADLTQASATRDAAAKVQATAAQLATLISQTSAALQGLGLAADAVSAGAAAVQAVSTFVANPTRQGAADLADSGAIQTMVKAAGALLKASPAQLAMLNLAAPDLAKAIVNVNSAIAHATGSSAAELVTKIGLIASNAGAVLAKLGAGDWAAAIDLTTSEALAKMPALSMGGSDSGSSTFGPPTLSDKHAYTNLLSLEFSEDVTAGSGKIMITDGATQTTYDSVTGQLGSRVVGATQTYVIDVHDSRVHFDGSELTVSGIALTNGHTYSVVMEPGVVRDYSGESYADATDTTKVQVPVSGSAEPPETSYAHYTTASRGYFNKNDVVYIEVQFESDVRVRSGETPSLTLTGGRVAVFDEQTSDTTLQFKYIVQAGDNLSDPDLVSAEGLVGKIESTAGVGLDATHISFDSIDNNGYGVIFDNTAPTASLDSAISGANPIWLNFSEPVYTTGYGSIRLISDDSSVFSVSIEDLFYSGNSIRLTNAGTLPAGHSYTVRFPGSGHFEDSAGNRYSNDDLTFTLPAASSVPSATAAKFVDSSDSALSVGDTIDFILTLDEAASVEGTPKIRMNTGHDAVFARMDDSTHMRFTYTVQEGDQVSHLGWDEANHASGLLNMVHNSDGGFLDNTHIVFTTIADGYAGGMEGPLEADGVAPVFDHGAVNDEFQVELTFSEKIIFTQGAFELHRASDDLLLMTINRTDENWESSSSFPDGPPDMLVFTLDFDHLPDGASWSDDFYIKAVGVPVFDYAGNPLTQTQTSFTLHLVASA